MIFGTEFLSGGEAGAAVQWIVGASATMFLANQALTFFKQHLREQPTPATTYLTIPNWKESEGERKADRDEIKKTLKEIQAAQEASNRYQAKARQMIHRRQNAMENALSFIAGRFEANGDHGAAEAIQRKIHTEGEVGDD